MFAYKGEDTEWVLSYDILNRGRFGRRGHVCIMISHARRMSWVFCIGRCFFLCFVARVAGLMIAYRTWSLGGSILLAEQLAWS